MYKISNYCVLIFVLSLPVSLYSENKFIAYLKHYYIDAKKFTSELSEKRIGHCNALTTTLGVSCLILAIVVRATTPKTKDDQKGKPNTDNVGADKPNQTQLRQEPERTIKPSNVKFLEELQGNFKKRGFCLPPVEQEENKEDDKQASSNASDSEQYQLNHLTKDRVGKKPTKAKRPPTKPKSRAAIKKPSQM